MGIFEILFGSKSSNKQPNTHEYIPKISPETVDIARRARETLNQRNPNGIVSKVPSEIAASVFPIRQGDQDFLNSVNRGALTPTEGADIIRANRDLNIKGK